MTFLMTRELGGAHGKAAIDGEGSPANCQGGRPAPHRARALPAGARALGDRTFRYTQAGKTREPSLGSLETLSLADALAKAADLRAKIKRGDAIDPHPAPVAVAARPNADTF